MQGLTWFERDASCSSRSARELIVAIVDVSDVLEVIADDSSSIGASEAAASATDSLVTNGVAPFGQINGSMGESRSMELQAR